MTGFCADAAAHTAIESATTFNITRILLTPTLLLAPGLLRLLALLLIVHLIAGRGRPRADRYAIVQSVCDVDDQCRARFDTGADVQFIAVITPDDDFLKMRLLVLGYCHHLRPVGANNQSRGWDSYRRLARGDAEFHRRVHARQKPVIGVP